MHEYLLMKEVIKTVLKEIEDKRLNKVTEVHVKKGHIHGHFSESFVNAYESLTKNTVLEGSKLVIEELKLDIKCEKCGESIEIGLYDHIMPVMECPNCRELVEVKNIPDGIEIKKIITA